MIIFGQSKEYVRHTEKLKNSECPHCKNLNTMQAEVLTKYGHIWYIPIFPTGKRVLASCEHCLASYDAKNLNGHLAQQCNEIKKDIKYPLKYWSWLIILALAFALVIGLGSLAALK